MWKNAYFGFLVVYQKPERAHLAFPLTCIDLHVKYGIDPIRTFLSFHENDKAKTV